MKGKLVVLVVLIILVSNICYALSDNEIVDIFEDIIVEANWYDGEYSSFSKLMNVSFEYELYKEHFEKEKLFGEIGTYHFLIKREADRLGSFLIVRIWEYANGFPSKEYSISVFTTLKKAKASLELEKATLVKTGTLKPSFSKLDYGPIGKKELGVAKEIISLLQENGSEYYGLESGSYTLYLKRFSIEDSIVPIVLCLPSGKEYYMYVGNLCWYKDYFSIDLDVSFSIPKYEGDFYWINQIKKDGHEYTFTL